MLSVRACEHRGIAARTAIALTVAVAVLFSAAKTAKAQDYPSHPVKIIVPFPAGGTADVMPRLFTDWLARRWGQPVVIENRSGAGGNTKRFCQYRNGGNNHRPHPCQQRAGVQRHESTGGGTGL